MHRRRRRRGVHRTAGQRFRIFLIREKDLIAVITTIIFGLTTAVLGYRANALLNKQTQVMESEATPKFSISAEYGEDRTLNAINKIEIFNYGKKITDFTIRTDTYLDYVLFKKDANGGNMIRTNLYGYNGSFKITGNKDGKIAYIDMQRGYNALLKTISDVQHFGESRRIFKHMAAQVSLCVNIDYLDYVNRVITYKHCTGPFGMLNDKILDYGKINSISLNMPAKYDIILGKDSPRDIIAKYLKSLGVQTF